MSKNSNETPVTIFTCKKCGKEKCRATEKYKDSPRIKKQWCSDCAYEFEYQEYRLEPLVKRIQKFMSDISEFPNLQAQFIEEVAKILKS